MKTPTSSSHTAKISIRVWASVFASLTARAEQLCLRRDAYLDRLLGDEIGELAAEVTKQNSDVARRYIDASLRELLAIDGKQVSIALQQNTIAALDYACKTINVHRDSFINRLIFLLYVPRSTFDRHMLDLDDGSHLNQSIDLAWDKAHLAGSYQPVEVLDRAMSSPFEGYRQLLEKVTDDSGSKGTLLGRGLYSKFIEDKRLHGLNCWMPDELVPGSPQYQATQRRLMVLLVHGKDSSAGDTP